VALVRREAVDEVFLPFPGPVEALPPVTHCKSTLLVASVRTLREQGYFERYHELLDPAFRDAVLSTVAGVWLPIEAAVAHYRGIDALGLTTREQNALGGAVSERLGSSVFGTIATLAKTSGVTPWTGLRHFQRFFDRFFIGGGTCVTRLGPKDARIEIVGLPLARIPYFVNGYRALIEALGILFCRKLFVTVLPRANETSIVFRGAWV
jgi:hypothetical protein